ncbi:MAG: pilus assembly protein [Acidiferrobacterales bacterium]
MKRGLRFTDIAVTGLMALTLGLISPLPARAAALDLSDVPLFLDLGVEPNVVLSMDTSGSMRRCYVLPGGTDSTNRPGVFDEYNSSFEFGTARPGLASADINRLYYDPTITYPVPVDGNGVSLGVPSFTGAWLDGYDQAAGTVDLSDNTGSTNQSIGFRPCWYRPTNFVDPFNPGFPVPDVNTPPPTPVGQRAYYLEYDGTGDITLLTSFTKRVVGTASDPSFGGNAADQEKNFAIWYSYFRNRLSVMKAAAGIAGADPTLDRRIRIAYQNLWGENGSSSIRQDISLMRLFTGQARVDFYNWLYGLAASNATPLRYTLDKVGRYYQNQKIDSSAAGHGYTAMNAVDSPWAFEPGVTKDPEFTCRQAFHVLLTDGLWNSDAGVPGNVDGTTVGYPAALDQAGTLTTYNPGAPYDDTDSATLADNAFKYWVTDLRTDLANDVPPFMPDPAPHPLTGNVEDNPVNDPATWQHMVNFTVSFGIDGQLPFNDTTYNGLLNDTIQWSGNEVDDLWHTAINSRGQYVRAESPRDLVDAFNSAISETLARTSSGAAVALNSGSLDADSRLYQARFNSGDWSGQVFAFDINQTTGAVITPAVWDAAAKLTTQAQGSGWDTGREILTFDGTNGVPFRWASLPLSMQTELNKDGQDLPDAAGAEQGQARLEFLRGSAAHEGTGNNYRVRANKLGDIVNGAPVFVGAPNFNYPDNLEASGEKYSAFKSAKSSRTPMLYVAANDGMLHGFDASPGSPAPANAGQEKIAYVPKAVFPRLTRLTSLNYAHRFFVDGPPTAGDVFYSDLWHTVLVGGLRNGGRGIYALDITNPASFAEANANSLVLWEFTDADDADLGFTYSQPAIVRMHNNKWAAVFGNGYNNTGTGHAVLFIVDIQTGAVIKKIDTGAGSALTPNGLATPAPVDVNGDRTIDYIYAGDLQGNLWKFDVLSSSPAAWGVAHSGSPLFVAQDASTVSQPITSRPEVSLHPQFTSGGNFNNGGYMIYFGTGRYVDTGDNITTGAQTQTFYAVWDPDTGTLPPNLSRSSLLQQSIQDQGTVTVGGVDAEVRVTTNQQIKWRPDPLIDSAGDHMGWYMDLINLGATPIDNQGERQVTNSVLREGRIIFTTLIPAGSSCVVGGSGFLMEVDAVDGSRLADPPFDFDNDGAFDFVNLGSFTAVVPSGIGSTAGAPSEPGILETGEEREYKYISGTDEAGIQVIHEQGLTGFTGGGTRESWRQLR